MIPTMNSISTQRPVDYWQPTSFIKIFVLQST